MNSSASQSNPFQTNLKPEVVENALPAVPNNPTPTVSTTTSTVIEEKKEDNKVLLILVGVVLLAIVIGIGILIYLQSA